MTASRDPDRLIHDFLQEGEEQLHDQIYDAVRAEIEQRPQRAFFGPWRTPSMNRIVGFGLAAAAVIVVAFIGYQLIRSPVGNSPTPTDSPSEATPSAEPSSPSGSLPQGRFAWFDPTISAEPRTDLPPITVTIPASGWECPQVGYDACILIQGGGESKLSVPDGTLPESALITWSSSDGILVYQDACQWEYNAPYPPATTADEVAAALAAQPGRAASGPLDVTVGGYPATVVMLHVPDDAVFADCFRGLYASFTLGGQDAVGTLPSRWHQGPAQIDTFWIVEVDGSIVIIDAMYRADTPAERVEEMRAIAESATFERP